jgi:hypothetical protein
MVENEYYYVWDVDYSGFMIGKCLGNIEYRNERGDSDAILICTFDDKNELSSNGWCFKDYHRKYRKATKSEINWLKRCIKLNKFIDYPKIKAYEIW